MARHVNQNNFLFGMLTLWGCCSPNCACVSSVHLWVLILSYHDLVSFDLHEGRNELSNPISDDRIWSSYDVVHYPYGQGGK